MCQLTISEALLATCFRYRIIFHRYQMIAEWLGCCEFKAPSERELHARWSEVFCRSQSNSSDLYSNFNFGIIAEHFTLEAQVTVIQWILEQNFFPTPLRIYSKNVLGSINSIEDKLL